MLRGDGSRAYGSGVREDAQLYESEGRKVARPHRAGCGEGRSDFDVRCAYRVCSGAAEYFGKRLRQVGEVAAGLRVRLKCFPALIDHRGRVKCQRHANQSACPSGDCLVRETGEGRVNGFVITHGKNVGLIALNFKI